MSRFDLPKEATEQNSGLRIQVNQIMNHLVENTTQLNNNRSVTPGQSKDYFEFLELVSKVIEDYQEREKSPYSRKADLSWDRPDIASETERITICLKERKPGAFDRGAPMQGSIKNWNPVLRQKVQDPNNPGYLKAVFGKWYDNLIGFTMWAQTNKEAIERAFWFEDLMEKYTWFFRASGVNRVLFYSQEEDDYINNDGKRLYGRQLIYFVRTEKITTISEKTIENIFVNLSVSSK